MKQRVLTSIAIIAGVIPLFFSQTYFSIILLFVAIMASFELNDLITDKKHVLLMLITFGLIFAFGLDVLSGDDKLIVASVALVIFVLLDLLYFEIKFNDLSLVYTISLLIGFALSSIMYLYKIDILLVLFVILVNYGNDAGAYLVGSQFGKRKLAPKISPNKTIEGSVGGIGFAAVLGIAFGYFFLPTHMSLFKVAILSFIIPIIAQIGDLFFSSLKRLYNKKDFGTIFPGHGGVLDRIDSLIFTLLFMIIMIRLGYLGVFV